MKIKAFFISILVLSGIALIAYLIATKGFASSPSVFSKTLQTKDTPLLIRSLITRMKDQLEKNNDTFPELIKEMESYAQICPDTASVSLLHSMIAEMYQRFYQWNQWNVNERTQLTDYVPKDIREWSKNLFDEKIRQELDRSLSPANYLQSKDIKSYQQLLTTDTQKSQLYPTLYDFLMARAIEIAPDTTYYQQWEQFRKAQNQPEVWLPIRIQQLHYLQQEHIITAEQQIAELKQLVDSLDMLPIANEARASLVDCLITNNRYRPEGERDTINQEILQICQKGIQKHPKAAATAKLHNQLNQLTEPYIGTTFPNQLYPGKKLELRLRYRNVKQIKVYIYKSLRQPEQAWAHVSNPKSVCGTLVKEFTLSGDITNSFTEKDSVFSLSTDLPMGLYECWVEVPDASIQNRHCFSVSRLATLYRHLYNKQKEVLITDAESGKPLPGVKIYYYLPAKGSGLPERAGEVITNTQGLALLPKLQRLECLRPVLNGDSSSVWSPVYGSYPSVTEEQSHVDFTLYTDRGLYRPGQNIFFKGILCAQTSETAHVMPNKSIELSLRNPQGQEISKKNFTTDAFGSIQGEFTLPAKGLSGDYTLTSNYGFAQFVRVEEYKRPSFFLEMEPITTEVSFNEKLTIRGKAVTFSGVKLTEGKVKWHIVRQPFWHRYYMPNPFDYTYKQVAEGETAVDAEGTFTIPFTPELDRQLLQKDRPNRPIAQSYMVTATLTDSKGETQECSFRFTAANVGITLQIDMADKMEIAEAKAEFRAQTLNNHPTEAEGNYTLYALSPKPSKTTDYWGDKEYTVLKTVSQGRFSSREKWEADRFQSLPSGRYRLELKSQDAKGREVTASRTFILYRKTDQRPPVFAEIWSENKSIRCLPNEKAELLFGTSCSNAYILYELYSQDAKCIHQEWVQLSNANRIFTIPFQTLYGPGITAHFTFVKEGKMYTLQKQIRQKRPDRTLRIVPQTFRDHLLPGSLEQWSFRIEKRDSTAAPKTQLLASMYDASLDQLHSYQWSMLPQHTKSLYSPNFREGSSFNEHNDHNSAHLKPHDYKMPVYPRLDWQGVLSQRYSPYSRGLSLRGGERMMMQAKSVAAVDELIEVTEDCVVAEEALHEPAIMQSRVESASGKNEMKESSTLRKNFAETAFFYPALVTNEQGEVSFSFTMPESNTTWKLQLMAHTEELNQGYWSQKVKTSKPLMVLPNLPRFMRQGDQITLSAQIINQSDQKLTGKVRLELFDPEKESTTDCLSRYHKPLAIAAGSQQTAAWAVAVPEEQQLIGCRIIAESEAGGDGEQHLIPVLSNQLLLIESTPFFLMDETEQTIQLTPKKGEKPFRYVIEVSANPIWQAVQALPTLTTPENNNILSWFASYYSNTLASYIVQAHPRIKQVITQWSAQGGDASTLLSNLEKNEELKNILLEETPWILEAQDESEQKRRLSLLFDLNRATALRKSALQHLVQEQLPDGGWSWFKGFHASRSITLSILRGMAQLTEMKVVEYDEVEKRMQIQALNYLDRQIQQDYEWLHNRNTDLSKVVPSPNQIDYLYIRSLYRDIPELGSARKAIRFYTAQAAKYWKEQDLYGKGEVALLMHANGVKETADNIMAWLRKTVTTDREKGMYWANNRRDNNYFTSPIETHCLLMSAFRTFEVPTSEIDRMKQWLLNQKRTQRWETEPATLNAIYTLMLTGSDWLSEQNACAVEWGNLHFTTEQGEAGTGYLKRTITQQEMTRQMEQPIKLNKTGKTPAWGAVYRQYFQGIDQVSKHKSALHIEKKFFVEENRDNTPQLRPLQTGETLKVGDKVVVRLVIRTDRDMDYVVLKDLRAGCFEPVNQLSGVEIRNGIAYYRSPKDVSEQFFFERLPQGTYVLEYGSYVSRSGNFTGGISTLQCLYAPEFVSHTEGCRLAVTPTTGTIP